ARRPPWMRRACSHACLAATLDAAPRAPSAAWRAVVGAHPRAAAAVATTPTRLSADAGEALDMHFSLALACHLGKLTTEFVSRVDGSRLEARTSVEEERMTGKVTMAAATAGHAEGGTTLKDRKSTRLNSSHLG